MPGFSGSSHQFRNEHLKKEKSFQIDNNIIVMVRVEFGSIHNPRFNSNNIFDRILMSGNVQLIYVSILDS